MLGVVPNVGHLFDLAMKAEQFRSGPGATSWILVCERARSVTPRTLDVFREKVHVSYFFEGREDMSWCTMQDAQSHTNCAHPHTHFFAEEL